MHIGKISCVLWGEKWNISILMRRICCFGRAATENIHNLKGGFPLPPLRDAVDDWGVLVAGEAEADKLFLVEQPCRLLQQLNPPPVVLDQGVVG